MTNFTNIKMILLIVLTILVSTSCKEVDKTKFIDLSGSWEIHSENRIVEKHNIELPGNWSSIINKNQNMTSIVWLRKKVFIDKSFEKPSLTLLLGKIAVADETYFNDIQIGYSGKIPNDRSTLDYEFSWSSPRKYYIPKSIINFEQENTISIKVYSHVVSGINGKIGIYSGDSDLLYENASSLIVGITSIAIHILFLIGLLILMFFQKKSYEFTMFPLLILLSLAGSVVLVGVPFDINGLLRYKIFIGVYSIISFVVLNGVMIFFDLKRRYIFWLSLVAVLLLELAIIFSPTTLFLIKYIGSVSLIIININLIISSIIFYIAFRKDPLKNGYFVFVSIPVPISVIHISYYLFTQNFNELPLAIFFHSPLLIMMLGIYIISDYESNKKEKDSLYSALLRKSNYTKKVLNSIEKIKTKPDPRDIINDLVTYLDSNYFEKYSRQSLSKKFGLNEDYMGQIFKKETGYNISNYINLKRIEASKELLIEIDTKIIDIAFHVGFDNLTHFHRQFKKIIGVTPTEYRKNVRSN